VTFYTVQLAGKRLDFLRAVVPTATIIGFLTNPNNPAEESEARDAEVAARSFGVRLEVLNTSNERDIDAAFTMLLERRTGDRCKTYQRASVESLRSYQRASGKISLRSHC
jgi:hypothetical protein